MDPSRYTDGMQTFVNPSLNASDIEHGQKESSSSCHYALDNLGGALMPWTDRAVFKAEFCQTTMVWRGKYFSVRQVPCEECSQTATDTGFLTKGPMLRWV